MLGSVVIHKTIIVPVVLYGCETWSHTLKKVRRLMVFERGRYEEYLGLRWTR